MSAQVNTMTNEERLQRTIRLERTDKILSGPAIMQFAATYCGMTQAEFLDPDKAEEAIVRVFDELGGWDILLMSPATGSRPPFPAKTLLPGRDLPNDSVAQILEEELMFPEDYDLVLEQGFDALNERLLRCSDPEGPPNVDPEWAAGAEARREAHLAAWKERGVAFMGSGIVVHPFQYFSLSRSLAKFAMDIRRMPDKVKAAMEACLPGLIGSALRDVERNGHRRVTCALDRGSPVFIGAKTFEELVLPSWLAFVDAMAKADIDVIFHCDTDWTRFLPYFREFPRGRCVLQLDGATDISQAKEVLGGHMALMGDVPATLLSMGSPDEVTAYCERLPEVVGDGGGFILSSGCSTPHDSKIENVRAMLAAGNSPATRFAA